MTSTDALQLDRKIRKERLLFQLREERKEAFNKREEMTKYVAQLSKRIEELENEVINEVL